MANYLDAAGLNIYHNGATINGMTLPAELHTGDIYKINQLKVTGESYQEGQLKIYVNPDKSITADGTTGSTSVYYTVATLTPDEIWQFNGAKLYGCPEGGDQYTYCLRIRSAANVVYALDTGSGATINVTDSNYEAYVEIVLAYQTTYTLLTFYPEISWRSEASGEPYIKSMYDLTLDTYVQDWKSKNLLPPPTESLIYNGITYTVNSDGTIVANGTATEISFFAWKVTLPAGGCVFSGCPRGGDLLTYRMDVRDYKGGELIYDDQNQYIITTGNPRYYYLSKPTVAWINIRIEQGYTANMLIFKPMIRKTTDTNDVPYVQYAKDNIDLTNNTYIQDWKSKNLLPNTSITETQENVTFTVNADGTILVDGGPHTYGMSHVIYNGTFPAGEYILSGAPEGSSANTNNLVMYDGTNWYNDYGSGVTFIASESLTYQVYIFVKGNTTVDNKLYKPMVRRAQIEDGTYVPYAKTNVELTNDPLPRTVSTWTGGTSKDLGGSTFLDASSVVVNDRHTTLSTALNGGNILCSWTPISNTVGTTTQITLNDNIYHYRGITLTVQIGVYETCMYIPRDRFDTKYFLVTMAYNLSTYYICVEFHLTTATTLEVTARAIGSNWASSTCKVTVTGCGAASVHV